MNDHCLGVSKAAEGCCPADADLRKDWLLALEKEHASLKGPSQEIAQKLKILSNACRVEILLMLEQREHCLDEMEKKLKTQKSAISYHLGLLNRCGMICKKRHSRFAFYSLSRKGSDAVALLKQ